MSIEEYYARQRANAAENAMRGAVTPSANVAFGPPMGEGWISEVKWRRDFECACGYMGIEVLEPARPLDAYLHEMLQWTPGPHHGR